MQYSWEDAIYSKGNKKKLLQMNEVWIANKLK
jgi:hypothetical protein